AEGWAERRLGCTWMHAIGRTPARWKGHLQHLLPAKGKLRAVKHHAALAFAELPSFMVELRQQPGVAARALELVNDPQRGQPHPPRAAVALVAKHPAAAAGRADLQIEPAAVAIESALAGGATTLEREDISQKQVAVADRIVLTKLDLNRPDQPVLLRRLTE